MEEEVKDEAQGRIRFEEGLAGLKNRPEDARDLEFHQPWSVTS